MNEQNKNIKVLVAMIIAVLGFGFILTGSSYAFLNTSGVKNSTIQNDLIITYSNLNTTSGDILALSNEFPISDNEGLNSKPYVFSIYNNSKKVKTFSVSLVNDTEIINIDECNYKLLNDSYVKYSINNINSKLISSLKNGNIINDNIGAYQTKT